MKYEFLRIIGKNSIAEYYFLSMLAAYLPDKRSFYIKIYERTDAILVAETEE